MSVADIHADIRSVIRLCAPLYGDHVNHRQCATLYHGLAQQILTKYGPRGSQAMMNYDSSQCKSHASFQKVDTRNDRDKIVGVCVKILEDALRKTPQSDLVAERAQILRAAFDRILLIGCDVEDCLAYCKRGKEHCDCASAQHSIPRGCQLPETCVYPKCSCEMPQQTCEKQALAQMGGSIPGFCRTPSQCKYPTCVCAETLKARTCRSPACCLYPACKCTRG